MKDRVPTPPPLPHEENWDKGFVPDYVFDKNWQETSFLIPSDEEIRAKLKQDLEYFSRYGVMLLPENQEARNVLLARVAAIDAYDAGLLKNKKKPGR